MTVSDCAINIHDVNCGMATRSKAVLRPIMFMITDQIGLAMIEAKDGMTVKNEASCRVKL